MPIRFRKSNDPILFEWTLAPWRPRWPVNPLRIIQFVGLIYVALIILHLFLVLGLLSLVFVLISSLDIYVPDSFFMSPFQIFCLICLILCMTFLSRTLSFSWQSIIFGGFSSTVAVCAIMAVATSFCMFTFVDILAGCTKWPSFWIFWIYVCTLGGLMFFAAASVAISRRFEWLMAGIIACYILTGLLFIGELVYWVV